MVVGQVSVHVGYEWAVCGRVLDAYMVDGALEWLEGESLGIDPT